MAPETPKGVSSRLLTMKFMQRAAASASSAGSPESDVPSSKKRKIEHSPAAGRFSASIDQAAIQAALADQEAKRQAALANHTAGDTHWVLNNSWDKAKKSKPANAPLKVVYVGYGDIDSSNESGDNEDAPATGRTSTRVKKSSSGTKTNEPRQDDKEDDSDEGSSENSDDNETPMRKNRHSRDGSQTTSSRSQSRSMPGVMTTAAKELRDKRRKKEVSLNKKITSISSGGQDQSRNTSSIECYNCHQTGHRATDCSKRSARGTPRKP